MRTLISLTLAVAFLVAANVQADLITFNLDRSKDPKVAGLLEGFKFEFSGSSESNIATLTFDLTSEGYAKGYHLGQDTVKFKDFGMKILDGNELGITDVSQLFIESMQSLSWDNGGWSPTSVLLTFVNGITWDSFADYIAGYMEILAHIQSIDPGGQSINEAVFTYIPDGGFSDLDDPPTTIPEPATLALMSLGLAGVGAVARRRMKK